MDSDDDLAKVAALTGLGVDEARGLLDAAAGSVELAVQLHFDHAAQGPGAEPAVRAPIAPTRARLSDDGFFGDDGDGAVQPAVQFFMPEPFGDNARANPQSATAARLASLYRPPTALLHQPPTLDAARATAVKRRQRFVLVTLFDATLFACHVQNRDLWNCEVVRDFVQEHMPFLQLTVTPDSVPAMANALPGDVYAARYRVQPPHIGLVDARTGELVHSLLPPGDLVTALSPSDFLDILSDLLSSPQGSEHSKISDSPRGSESAIVEAPKSPSAAPKRGEPEEDAGEEPSGPDAVTVMFRGRDGRRFARRFLPSDSLATVHRTVAKLVTGSAAARIRLQLGPTVVGPDHDVSVARANIANSLLMVVVLED